MSARSLLSLLLLIASAGHCLAAPPFTCKATGDTWSIVGAPSHRVSCSFRCILREPAGSQDSVSCSAVVSPGPPADPICEGFLMGKHWTSATLVAVDCAMVGAAQ